MTLHDALARLDEAPHWKARLALQRQWRADGLHKGKLMTDLVRETTALAPDVPVIFGSRERPSETTNGQMLAESYEVAAALRKLGLAEGDVLVAQVPNWAENTLALLAAMHLGLIYVPMVHIYGPSELAFVLNTVGAKALLIPDRWKKIDYSARIGALGETPTLEHIIVIGDEPMSRPVLRWSELDRSATAPLPALRAQPDDAWLIMFTSGTTASPKGVVHSHNSFGCEVGLFPSAPSPTGRSKLMPLPAGHSAGVIAALRPFLALDAALLMDAFEEELAIDLIRRHRPDRAGGVPFMVSMLLDRADDLFPAGMVQMSMGAASIPPALMERCEARGWPGTRTYGLTEHPTISGSFPADPFDKRATTDGRLLAGVQVRLVDEDGHTVPVGTPGEIVSIGPDLCKGYLDPQQNLASFAADGWFHTGDIGVMDDEGYLRIVDRKKDIIIRGGENISSKEVEDVLTRHPAVAEVAAVAWPDERLGERVCVFVKPNPSATIDLAMIDDHFATSGVARQKAPERLVILDEFPRAPAGKILKTQLRERARLLARSDD